MIADLLITHIKGLVQVRPSTPHFLAGSEMSKIPVIADAWLAIAEEKIIAFGSMKDMPSFSPRQTLEVSGQFVFPSFVDSHTHMVSRSVRIAPDDD